MISYSATKNPTSKHVYWESFSLYTGSRFSNSWIKMTCRNFNLPSPIPYSTPRNNSLIRKFLTQFQETLPETIINIIPKTNMIPKPKDRVKIMSQKGDNYAIKMVLRLWVQLRVLIQTSVRNPSNSNSILKKINTLIILPVSLH